jgi:phosphoribosyl 1,2-cyclic phosphodiesterase
VSLKACVLASGSSGNALLVKGPEGAVLLDAGLTLKDLGRRLNAVGCDPDELRGVLVTHGHGDHVSGAGHLARRLDIPVWLSRGTAEESAQRWRGSEDLRVVKAGECFTVAGIDMDCWACSHDTREPLQFGFRVGEASAALCTDLGEADPVVRQALCHRTLLFVESNHDPEILRRGAYPPHLKRRILGSQGHLSNAQCATLLQDVAGPRLQGVVLSHLSRENNRPELALDVASQALAESGFGHVKVWVGDPFTPGPWLDVFSGHTC